MKIAPSREYRVRSVIGDFDGQEKTLLRITHPGGRSIIVNMNDGIVKISTDLKRDPSHARSINKFFEKANMPHRIKCNGEEWWVVLPGNRSQRFFDGIKFGLSARQWISIYRNTDKNYLLREVLD